MKTIVLALAFSLSLLAADAKAPELTDKQKLAVREAELTVIQQQAEKTALESRLKDLAQSLPQAQIQLSRVTKEVTPAGYVLQMDLTLRKDPNARPEAEKK